LRQHSGICTYFLVRMPPGKRRQVRDLLQSDDCGSATHSGDDTVPEPAAAPAVYTCLLCRALCETLLLHRMSCRHKSQGNRSYQSQSDSTYFAYMFQQNSPFQEAVVVARTKSALATAGNGLAPVFVSQALASSRSHCASW
jgi:hypothetical protein